MSGLQVSLLGPFRIGLGGQSVAGFRSDKVRALLAYLAAEAAREHSREVLAGLLWPEWTEREALANLRYSLSNLRHVIDDRNATPPFLLISRDTLQFNLASQHAIDVRTFNEQMSLDRPDALASAVDLYRGPFLEGFSVADAAPFEEWALLKREQLARQLRSALGRLAEACEGQGEYSAAEAYARRRVELEPWEEEGQRQLMRALARGGQRSAALQQYQVCLRVLKEELGATPQEETTALYRQIQAGELGPPRSAWNLRSSAAGPSAERAGGQVETPVTAGAVRASGAAQRRLVTVLCCQIGTRASEAPLDPEEAAAISGAAQGLVAAAVTRHQGTLLAASSSEMLALFGAGAAREDDPERAVRAALEAIATAQTRDDYNLHIAISTGLLLLEQRGVDPAGGASIYQATGEAVTLAMRLAGRAPTSGILISHDTYRHLRGIFDIRTEPPVEVQGRAAPVRCYRVLGAKLQSFRRAMRGVEGVETRMVGREVELQALQQAYQDVLAGSEARFVTIVGDPGVGKSRLLYEFADWLDLRPERQSFFTGRASATTQGVPFSLVRDLFVHRFEIQESDPAAEALAKFRRGMAPLLPADQADLVGQLVGFGFAAASAAVQGMLRSGGFGRVASYHLVEYFRALLAGQPVVLLLEDLHWADDSSLDLLAHLVQELPAERICAVGTARPGLYERRPSWGEGEAGYSRLELHSLSKRASQELVNEILKKVAQVPAELQERLVAEAEGNPFYLEELIKMLVEHGAILVGEEQWQVLPERLAGVRLPSTLAGVLQARLDALSVEERAVLQRAAVVGRSFWDTLVSELAGDVVPGGQVAAALQRLRARELIFRRERSRLTGTTEYVFKHVLLRDVTYETVLLEERRQCHGQVARWLEGQAGERLAEHLTLIAGHYRQAGQVMQAAAYLQRAGEEAFRVGALRYARTALEEGLALLREPGGAEETEWLRHRARLLVGLGQVMRHLVDLQVANERLEAGRALAGEAGDRHTEARALVALGEAAIYMGRYERARPLLEEGLALARACADQGIEGDAMFWLSYLYFHQSNYEQAVHWGEASLAFCRARGDRWGTARSLNGLMEATFLRPAEYERARAYGLECLALSRELGDLRGMASVQCNLGGLAHLQSRYDDEARAMTERAGALAEQIGARTLVINVRLLQALVCLDDGHTDAAWAHLRAGLREAQALHAISYCLVGVAVAARLYLRQGLLLRAAELAGLSLQVRSVWWARDWPAFSATLQQALSPDELNAAMARGKALDLEQAVQEILAAADEQAMQGG